jgi:hypothetical protein
MGSTDIVETPHGRRGGNPGFSACLQKGSLSPCAASVLTIQVVGGARTRAMHISLPDLRAVLAAGEGKTTEFKRGLQRDGTLARTLAAFANTRGGLLLVGVGDRGEIVGAPQPHETMQHLEQIALKCVDPPLEVEIMMLAAEGGRVVVCSVPLSPRRPHAALTEDGERIVLVRAGSSNRVAGPDHIAGLVPDRGARPGSDAAHVLEWIERSGRRVVLADCARALNFGLQRARRALSALERAGLLIGHGIGDAREFRAP